MAIQDILPAGWRVQNSTGSFAAPLQSYSDEEDDGGHGDDGLNEEDLRPDSPGWEDVKPEEDVEIVEVTCLCCEEVFRSSNGVREMVSHCKEVHGLDLDEIRKKNSLDFFATIRLVNYIRDHYTKSSSASTGASSQVPDLSNPGLWADDKFLQPVLEDDALLYSIDELANPEDSSDPLATKDDEDEDAGKGKDAVRAERVVVERALR